MPHGVKGNCDFSKACLPFLNTFHSQNDHGKPKGSIRLQLENRVGEYNTLIAEKQHVVAICIRTLLACISILKSHVDKIQCQTHFYLSSFYNRYSIKYQMPQRYVQYVWTVLQTSIWCPVPTSCAYLVAHIFLKTHNHVHFVGVLSNMCSSQSNYLFCLFTAY